MAPLPPDESDGSRSAADELDEPALEAPLLAGLAEVFPGFELLDSDLEFERLHRIHYVGLDGEGRLTLVIRVRGEGHTAVLRALDARDFARRHLAPLLKHLGASRARADLEPRIALVAPEFDERLRRRLDGLVGAGVEAYELRRLRSHSGELVFLAPLGGFGAAVQVAAPTLEEWLTTLAPERRQQVEELLTRLERLDEGLAVEQERHGLRWRIGERPLASLEVDSDGGVRLTVAGRPPRRWRTPRDLDLFLDDTVAEYLARLDDPMLRTVDLAPEPRAADQPSGARRSAVGARSRPRGLISPEELEAFGE